MNMELQYIDHIVIIVQDIEKTENFYSHFLGKPIQKDSEQVAYQIGKTKLFFGLPYSEWNTYDKDKTGLNHLAFGVKTKEELVYFEELLKNKGIENSGIKIDEYGNKEFIWFDDPDGYRLEIYRRPWKWSQLMILKN